MKKTASIVLIATLLVSTVLFAVGCSSATEVDLAKYVTYTGYSGYASLQTSPSIEDYEKKYDELKEKRNEAKDDDDDDAYEDYKEQMKELKSLNKALSLVTFKLTKGKNGNLSNGDKIKIKAKYKEEKLEKYNIKFTADEFELKVEGLEEKEVVDPFADEIFKPEFSGLDGDGTCNIKTYEDSDKKIEIYYSLDKSYDLSNGDKVVVTASIYNDDFVLKDSEDDGSTATKEITVEGLGEIPSTLDGVDTSAVDEKFLEKIKEESTIEKGLTDRGYSFHIYGDDYRYATLKILSAGDIEVARQVYGYKNSTDGKSMVYGIVYSQDVEVKITDPSYSSKLKKGTTKKTQAYYIAYMNSNLMVSDNKLVIRDEDYYYVSTSLGFETVDSAVKDLEDYYDSYEFSTVESSQEATEPATEETTTEKENTTTESSTEKTTEPTTSTAKTETTKSTQKTTKKV